MPGKIMTQKWTKLSSVFLWADPRTRSMPSKLVKDCQDMKQIYQQWMRACCFKYPTMNTLRNTHTHMTEREKGRKEKERKKERGNHGPGKEEDKLALTSWTIAGATLCAQWVSHTVLGRSSRWARGCWAQLPQEHIRVTSSENTQHQQEASSTPRMYRTVPMELGGKGREAIRSGLSPREGPRWGLGTGARRSSLERPMHTMHWALQPWDDPRR